MITFIAATYNESGEIEDLLDHVGPYVDRIIVADDGSADQTIKKVVSHKYVGKITLIELEHTGLPETVKKAAVEQVYDNSWVLLLDCDERFQDGVLQEITNSLEDLSVYSHVWFSLHEYINGQRTKGFAKVRLFKKEAVTFSDTIHKDEEFTGDGFVSSWVVLHRKTVQKQIMREREYIETYKRLLSEGRIDQGTFDYILSNHYFIRG